MEEITLLNQIYNNTVLNETTQGITKACQNWCLEQHFTFQHNEIINLLWVLPVALISLSIAKVLLTDEKKSYIIKRINLIKGEENLKKRIQIANVFISLANWTIIIMTGYIIYNIKYGFLKP